MNIILIVWSGLPPNTDKGVWFLHHNRNRVVLYGWCRMASYKIVNGPSKWNFMLSLFDGDRDHRREITLDVETLEGNHSLPCVYRVESVEREDDSGESWNLILRSQVGLKLKARYSTRTRKGSLAGME